MEPYLHFFRADTIPFKSSLFDYNESTTYTFNPGFDYALATNLKAGLDFNVSSNSYKEDINNSSTTYSLGPTFNWDITPNVNISGNLNYIVYQVTENGTNGDTSQPRDVQWGLSFLHIPRANFQYSLFTTQALNYGYLSNATRTTDIGASFQWRFLKRTTLRAAIVHESGQDSGGIDPEKYTTDTGGFGLDFAMNPRTTLSFDFEHSKKQSNVASRDYVQDRFIVGLAYDF
jgi:predicted porin